MKFTVVRQRWAEDELTEIWLAASSQERAEITDVADSIDALLRYNPEQVGESRSGQMRIVILPPLVCTFDVRHGDRIVDILAVHRLPKS